MPGTIRGKQDFDDKEAAEKLWEAVDGIGTTESVIIKLLASLNYEQRKITEDTYKQSHGEDLVERLKSELSGNFENAVVALMTEPRLFDARELKRAVAGAGTDETVLIEIMCSRSNDQLEEIKELYKQEFDADLEEDLMSDTSGHFGRMMVSLCTASRKEDEYIDDEEAEADAEIMREAGEASWGTDEIKFNAILCLRGRYQLRRTFDRYEELTGKTIEESIESECSSDLKNGYLAIIKMARDPPKFFAERIHSAASGCGTDDCDLIRLLVSRSEIDLKDIMENYEQMYETTLLDCVADECSGDYCDMLRAIVNPEEAEDE